MITYVKNQLLVHLSHSAKQVTKTKGHSLKKNMPRNLSKRNALRVARFRSKSKDISLMYELEQEVIHATQEKKELVAEVNVLKDKVEYYETQFGDANKRIPKSHREQLQKIISLQREVYDKQHEAKVLYNAKQISKKEFEILNKQFEENQNILRKKKQRIFLS